jgi:hypothetical protein
LFIARCIELRGHELLVLIQPIRQANREFATLTHHGGAMRERRIAVVVRGADIGRPKRLLGVGDLQLRLEIGESVTWILTERAGRRGRSVGNGDR